MTASDKIIGRFFISAAFLFWYGHSMQIREILGLVLLFSFFFSTSGQAAENCRDQWPTVNWPEKTLSSVGFDAEKFKAFEEYIFGKPGSPTPTESVVIIKNGCLVYERYARGFNASMKHVAWSMSKSFSSALIGIAEQDGYVSRDEYVKTYLPYFNKSGQEKIRVRDVLHMRSGLDWSESYSNFNSNVVNMLYKDGFNNFGKYVATIPAKYEPGSRFNYSTGDTMILTSILKAKLPPEKSDSYPWTALFDKIGMNGATWERDLSDAFAGGTSVYATPRDFAKFGYLFLNEGMWNGEQIVPKEWKEWSTSLPENNGNTSLSNYGAQWWLNIPIEQKEQSKPYGAVSEDAFMAIGFHGQLILIIPSLDMVVVRTGYDKLSPPSSNEYTRLLMASLNLAELTLKPMNGPSLRDVDRESARGTASGYYAKEFCSCYFVSGQTEQYCRDNVVLEIPGTKYEVDKVKKTVTAKSLGTSHAKWVSERFGCVLTNKL